MTPPRLRVLLTGPGGRIGPHILPTFRERFDLTVLDRNPVPGFDDTVISDLSDLEVLRAAMEGVDTVVHLAATSDEAPFVEQLVPNNVVGLYNVFEAARLAGVKRIVFASTVQTVGHNPPGRTIAIADPPRPVTLYACTKLLGEVVGRLYHDAHGIEFVGVRIGWFHPYDSPQLRRKGGAREIWLSPRDAAGILATAASHPGVGYALVFGTSITEFERLSRAELKEHLGYEPVDDIRTIPLDPESA